MNRHDAIAYAGGRRNRYNTAANDESVALWVDDETRASTDNEAADAMVEALRFEVETLARCYREIAVRWADVAVKLTVLDGLDEDPHD